MFFQTSPSHEAGEGGAERSDRRGACWTSSDTRTRNLSLMVSPIFVCVQVCVCFVVRWYWCVGPCLSCSCSCSSFVDSCLYVFYSRYSVHTDLITRMCYRLHHVYIYLRISKQQVTLDEPLWYGGMRNGQLQIHIHGLCCMIDGWMDGKMERYKDTRHGETNIISRYLSNISSHNI